MDDFDLLIFAGIIATLVVAIYYWPSVAIGAFLCMFGLEQWIQSRSAFMVTNPATANIVIGSLVFYAFVLRVLRSELNTRAVGPVFWLVFLLFAYSSATSLWSMHTAFAAERWSMSLPFVLTGMIAAPWLIAYPKDLQPAVLTTYLLGVFVVVAVLFSGGWVEGSRHLNLADGESRGNPLALAKVAGYTAIAGAFLAIPRISRPTLLLKWIGVAAALCVTVLSGSRGQFFGSVATIVCFLPFADAARRRNSLERMAIVVGVVLALSYFAFSSFSGHLSRWDLSTMKYDVAEARLSESEELLALWMRGSPAELLLGLGTCSSFELIGWYPHCIPVEVLAEEGVVGFGLYAGILVLTFQNLMKARRTFHSPAQVRTATIVGAFWVFLLILTLKQGSLLSTYDFCLLAIVLERANNAHRNNSQGRRTTLAHHHFNTRNPLIVAQRRRRDDRESLRGFFKTRSNPE